MYNPDKSKSIYTRESREYDASRYECGYGYHQLKGIYHSLDTFVSVGERTRILDVATGTGVVALYLARKGGVVDAIDLTEAMVDQARRKAESLGLRNVNFRIGSATELPYANESFDIATSNKFFHLIPHEMQQQVIKEMFRVLKPGGCLVIEFKNILYGGVLRGMLKYVLRRQEGHCILPVFANRLFPGGKITGMIGYYLPSQRRLPEASALHSAIEKGGHAWPLKLVYDKICIRCEKVA